VLTTRDASGRDHGMTISAFSSASLNPPLILVCVDHDASSYATLMTEEWIGVSILAEDQAAYAKRFADRDADRFDDLEIKRGQHGVPLLVGAAAHLECRIVARHEAGDHTIIVASVDGATALEGRPLLYYRGGFLRVER